MEEKEFEEKLEKGEIKEVKVEKPKEEKVSELIPKKTLEDYQSFLEMLRRIKQHGSSVPTHTPKSYLEQFYFYESGGTRRLYAYINGAWQNIAGITDHGALGGLADDDHPQYHNDARGDARYYTEAEVNALIAGVKELTFFVPFETGVRANSTPQSVPGINFVDGNVESAYGVMVVPAAGQTISSIKMIYMNGNASKVLRFTFMTSQIDTGSLPAAAIKDETDSETSYNTGATGDRWEAITVPAGAYDALTLAAGDILAIRAQRTGGAAEDTYDANLAAIGFLVTFS